MKCILASGDGFELNQKEYPNYEEAYKAMKKGYDEVYNPDADEDDESYCDSFSAKVVISGEDIYLWEITKVSQENVILWKDVVCVDGRYYYFVVPVEFECDIPDVNYPMEESAILSILDGNDPVYNCDNFFDYVEQTLGCDHDDVTTYSFDDIDVPVEELKRLGVDIALLGGYINGVNI